MKRLAVAMLMITLVASQAVAQSRLATALISARDASVAQLPETDASVTGAKPRVCLRKLVVRSTDDGYSKLPVIVCASDKSLVSESRTAIAPFRTDPARRALVSRLPQRYTGAVFRPPIA